MSLNVYLRLYPSGSSEEERSTIPGIFIREGGSMQRLSRDEWDRRNPGIEPFTTTPSKLQEGVVVYECNITHNLGAMAAAADLYPPLWRPDEHRLYLAHQLIAPLSTGLDILVASPLIFKALNPRNGYGSYEGLVEFTENYLTACKNWPGAAVSVSR